jgi:hypothetical protein
MSEDLSPTEIDRIKYDKIQKAKDFEKNVNEAVNLAKDLKEDVQQIKKEVCEGPDCLKAKVEEKFGSIDEKIKKIEEKTSGFVCENCGYANVPALSSFCPQCGSPIYEWSDDEGQPVKGWKHWTDKGAEVNT